jgi:hypothetical protein
MLNNVCFYIPRKIINTLTLTISNSIYISISLILCISRVLWPLVNILNPFY